MMKIGLIFGASGASTPFSHFFLATNWHGYKNEREYRTSFLHLRQKNYL